MKIRALVGSILISVLSLSHAAAGPGPIPLDPNVVDIAGDANYLAHAEQDVSGPVQNGYGDIIGGWFTQDAKSVTAHIQLAADPREAPSSLIMWLVADPYLDTQENPLHLTSPLGGYCFVFAGLVGNNPNDNGLITGRGIDYCNSGSLEHAAKVTVVDLSDGSFSVRMRVPRVVSPALREGSLDAPRAMISHRLGIPIGGINAPAIDLTPAGRDYKLR